MNIWSVQPTYNEISRFADDGGRIPERDRCIPIIIGAILRIRLPTEYRVTNDDRPDLIRRVFVRL